MNRVVLTARIAQAKALRYTPAGIPALDLELDHEGETAQAGTPKQVRLQVKAVSFGMVAEQLQQVPLGSQHQFTGFLDAARNGRSVVLHITAFEKIES